MDRAKGAEIPNGKSIKDPARLREQTSVGANEHQARFPHAPSRGRGYLLDLWSQSVQTAKIAIQGKHLRPEDTVRIVAASLRAEFQQLLDPTLQTGPFTAQQGQGNAMGARPALMEPEAGGTQAFILPQKNLQILDFPGLEV